MKNLKLFVLLLSVGLMSYSCKNDDDGGSSSGSGVVIYGDTEIQLKSGVIMDYGEYMDGIYNFDITLVDTQVRTVDGYPFPTEDVFSGVYFELFTSNVSDLQVGTYNFGSADAGGYEYAEVYINATIEQDEGISINSGSFSVLDNGSSYELEFEGTTSDGTAFSGSFSGPLRAYDFSDEFGRPAEEGASKPRLFFR